MSTRDDMEAINQYFGDAQPVTPAAAKLKDDWIKWYNGLSWWGKGDSTNYDDARNRRFAYNTANATTPAEQQAVIDQQKHGLTTEQLKGEADKRLSSGGYNVERPLIPTKYKVYLGVFAVVTGAIVIVKKVYIDPFLPSIKRFLP